MDYRALLVKYIGHVSDEEGVDFLGTRHDRYPFTDDEWTELQQLREEVPERSCTRADGRHVYEHYNRSTGDLECECGAKAP